MIDEEMIPDLGNPALRAMYDALLGKRKATRSEKATVLAVQLSLEEAEETGDQRIKLPNPAYAVKVALIMQRAFNLDEEGYKRRIQSWYGEFIQEAEDTGNV